MSDEIPTKTKQQQINNAAALVIAMIGDELAGQAQGIAADPDDPFQVENAAEEVLEVVRNYLSGTKWRRPLPPMPHQLTYQHAICCLRGGEGE